MAGYLLGHLSLSFTGSFIVYLLENFFNWLSQEPDIWGVVLLLDLHGLV